jgi:hypothetical protein
MENIKDEIVVEPTMVQPKEELVAGYKKVFQQLINMRPSGTRNKIAKAIAKNKSFVSQITNPSYSVPIPAKHLETIFNICHFSLKERETLLKYYIAAHPNYQYRIESTGTEEVTQTKLVLDVPVLNDPLEQQKVESIIRDFSHQLFELMKTKQK